MHKIAAFSEFALMLLIENLALPRPVKIRRAEGILGSQLLHTMCKSATCFIWAISLFDIVLAELDLQFIAFVRPALAKIDGLVTLAGVNRVVLNVAWAEFVFGC